MIRDTHTCTVTPGRHGMVLWFDNVMYGAAWCSMLGYCALRRGGMVWYGTVWRSVTTSRCCRSQTTSAHASDTGESLKVKCVACNEATSRQFSTRGQQNPDTSSHWGSNLPGARVLAVASASGVTRRHKRRSSQQALQASWAAGQPGIPKSSRSPHPCGGNANVARNFPGIVWNRRHMYTLVKLDTRLVLSWCRSCHVLTHW